MKGIAVIAGFLLLEAAFLFHAALPNGVQFVARPPAGAAVARRADDGARGAVKVDASARPCPVAG